MQTIWKTNIYAVTVLVLSDLCQRKTDAVDVRKHTYCRKLLRNEIRKRKNSSQANELPKKLLRLSLERDCFYCHKLCLIDERHPVRIDIHSVETLHLREIVAVNVYQQRS